MLISTQFSSGPLLSELLPCAKVILAGRQRVIRSKINMMDHNPNRFHAGKLDYLGPVVKPVSVLCQTGVIWRTQRQHRSAHVTLWSILSFNLEFLVEFLQSRACDYRKGTESHPEENRWVGAAFRRLHLLYSRHHQASPHQFLIQPSLPTASGTAVTISHTYQF